MGVEAEEGGPAVEDATAASAETSEVQLTAEERALCRQNVICMFIFQAGFGICLGICMGPMLDKYLQNFADRAKGHWVPKHARNSLVGFSESVSGVSSLLIAIPVAVFVDKHPQRRARLLKVALVFCCMGTVLGTVAFLLDEIITMYVALILFGAYMELASSASEAIFADSIPQGERSGKFVTKSMIGGAAQATGPGLAAILVKCLGDEWTVTEMKVVIILGLVLLPFGSLSLLWIRDPPACLQQKASDQSNSSAGTVPTTDGDAESNGESQVESASNPNTAVRRCGPLRQKHIPVCLAVADFISCIGAGMTVKFFNLFFIDDEKFTPFQVNGLQAVYPLVIVCFMKMTEQLAKPLGRAQASFSFFALSTACLVLLAQVHNLFVLLLAFLIRGGLANSSYPIDRSILMDFTPSSQRGCWNAVESFTSMTWTGSAFLGGLLTDTKDFRFTFLITAFVYALSLCAYAPLLVLVPRKEGDSRTLQTSSDASGTAVSMVATGGTATLQVPLMDEQKVVAPAPEQPSDSAAPERTG